jgi:hypothetical protein
MEFYSATKKNEILSFAGKQMELENITVSEVSQVQKAKDTYFLSYVEYRLNTNVAVFETLVILLGDHAKERSHK